MAMGKNRYTHVTPGKCLEISTQESLGCQVVQLKLRVSLVSPVSLSLDETARWPMNERDESSGN